MTSSDDPVHGPDSDRLDRILDHSDRSAEAVLARRLDPQRFISRARARWTASAPRYDAVTGAVIGRATGPVLRSATGGAPATLEEVATRAGVGRGTVSRVVNDSPKVRPEVRQAVLNAMAELGYLPPSRRARALVTQRTDMVALVVPDSLDRVLHDPMVAALARSVEATLGEAGYNLWLATVRSPLVRERLEHHLTNEHVDGVLLLSSRDDDPLPRLLAQRGVPTVLGGRTPRSVLLLPESSDEAFVDVDHVGGARLAVQHLIAAGRHRIATIAGPPDTGAGHGRLAGFRAALTAAGHRADRAPVVHGDFKEPGGFSAMQTLLQTAPDVDAVFVANDAMALGALRALRETGRRVPQDVAVIGFDDAPAARRATPALTTVRHPIAEQGRQMVRLLRALIQREPPPPSAILEAQLIHRASG